MQDLSSMLPGVCEIAQNAGAAILKVYHDDSISGEVDYKADNSPLTLADRAAHRVIAAALTKQWPDIPLLSEEGKEIPFEERASWDRFWLVDPLDGTKEFVKRNGEFTVNIALIENGQSILGVVYVPVSGETYFAAKDQGAFFQPKGGVAISIESASFSREASGLRMVCSRSHMSAEVEAYVSQFTDPQTVSMGSSLKFMLVAKGDADIYPRLAPTMEWDTGAAHIIVEEAGGKVIDQETQQPLRYNKEILRNPHFIAFGDIQD